VAAQVVSAAGTDLIPVTILTGFLGAGKTTLLASLLKRPAFARTAVIINEFGETGLDHDLVRAETDCRVTLLESGCVCCSLRSDLTDTLRDLFRQRVLMKIPAFERVVIETTGLADPLPILNALQADPVTAVRFRLDGVVTVVDALEGDAQMDVHPEAVRQAAMADRLILAKTDLANAEAVARLKARLAALNPGVTPVVARRGAVEPEAVFGPAPGAPPWLHATQAEAAAQDHDHHHDHDHRHDHGIASFTLPLPGPHAWDRVAAAFETLLAAHGDRILRLKGMIEILGEPLPVVIHGVGHTLYPTDTLPAWPAGNPRGWIVFITQDLDKETVAALLAEKLG
jgi:G3E family GTPase